MIARATIVATGLAITFVVAMLNLPPAANPEPECRRHGKPCAYHRPARRR